MKVSVCVATYQGEEYIKEQLESVLGQLGPDDEVVVSDDCSTDATLDIIDRLRDPRVRILRNATNLGYSANFARALASATGDVIFLCDQDDVWLPQKVETMLKALDGRDMVVADVIVVDQELTPLEDSHFVRHGVRSGFLHNFLQTRYIGASMVITRRVLDVGLPFPANTRHCAYDYWITLVGEAFFDVGLVPTPQMLYRRHGHNASTGGSHSENTLAHRVYVRIYCLMHLLLRSRRVIRSP